MTTNIRRFPGSQAIYLLFLLATGMILIACEKQLPTKDVEPIAKGLFEELKKGDVETALNFYSDEFYETIPRGEWKKKLQTFLEKVGPIKSYRIRSTQADTRFSGRFYIFTLETIHQAETVEDNTTTQDDTSQPASNSQAEKNADPGGLAAKSNPSRETSDKAQHIVTFIHHVNDTELKLIAHKITAKKFNKN